MLIPCIMSCHNHSLTSLLQANYEFQCENFAKTIVKHSGVGGWESITSKITYLELEPINLCKDTNV